VIDVHTHILPALDDGAPTLEVSREIARRAIASGTRALVATPHVRHDFPTSADAMETALAAVRADLLAHGIPVHVHPGGELDLEWLARLTQEELNRFSLAQTGRYLLVEFPYHGWPLGLEQQLFDLQTRGFTPLLAHPERNSDVQRRPERVAALVRAGACVQVTAGSVEGRLGRGAQAAALALLDAGIVHVVASDAHSPELRDIGLAGAVAAIADEGVARVLTEEAPAAIVAGEDIEPSRARARGAAPGRFDRILRRISRRSDG
jgi:protein-tyrosine phosphatase